MSITAYNNPTTLHDKNHDEWVQKANQLMMAKQLIQKYTEIENQLLQELKILSNDESYRAGGFIFNKIVRKGVVDYSQIPELSFVDLENYRKPEVVIWRLSMENK